MCLSRARKTMTDYKFLEHFGCVDECVVVNEDAICMEMN